MNKKIIFISCISIAGLIGLMVWGYQASLPKADPAVDNFAQCLADKKVVMYGAYWCPHCQNQKKLFGTSFEYVPYVECTQEAATCKEKDIKGYPTWIFADGTRIEGEATFEQLAKKTSCQAP